MMDTVDRLFFTAMFLIISVVLSAGFYRLGELDERTKLLTEFCSPAKVLVFEDVYGCFEDNQFTPIEWYDPEK